MSKDAKYQELVEVCKGNGWKARCEPTEVRRREFPGQSRHCALRLLGMKGLQEREATTNISEAAESFQVVGDQEGRSMVWCCLDTSWDRPGDGV